MSSLISHLRRGFGENMRFAMLAVRAHKLRALADGARHRRRRLDGDRDGVDRHRLQQQHGRAASRASARRSCSSRSSRRGSGPGHRSDDGAQPQGPDARGRARAEGPDPRDPRASRRSATSATAPTSRSSTAATSRRRRPSRASIPTTRSPTTTSSSTAASSPRPTSRTRSQVARHRHRTSRRRSSRNESPLEQDRRAERLEVHGHRHPREEGRLRRRLQQPLVLHPLLDLRPPVPADQEQPRRHDPHRDGARTGRTRSDVVIEKGRALLRARRHVPLQRRGRLRHPDARQDDRELPAASPTASRAR